MKGLFKSKPRTPADVVRQTRELLISVDLPAGSRGADPKREEEKMGHVLDGRSLLVIHKFNMAELSKNIRDLKCILYGNGEHEPVTEACVQLTQEFFRENTLRLLIMCVPKVNLETRKDSTQVVANLQRQQVNSRILASEYLEANKDLLDTLISGYEDTEVALHYGAMLRECIRHQSIARYVLESDHMKKFFDYIQIPNFDIASDASATFKELLTRHKATVAEFLSKNYDWFFAEFNSRLLSSSNYITKRQAIKLLGDMLLDRSNSAVMMRYVSSKDNLMILMNLLRDSSKNIQIESFHVFKLFAANKNKPAEVVNILVTNRSKLLRFFAGFKTDKGSCMLSVLMSTPAFCGWFYFELCVYDFPEDEQFEADKEQSSNGMNHIADATMKHAQTRFSASPDGSVIAPTIPANLAVIDLNVMLGYSEEEADDHGNSWHEDGDMYCEDEEEELDIVEEALFIDELTQRAEAQRRKQSIRKGSYTKVEDTLICESWMEIRQDPKTGAEQKDLFFGQECIQPFMNRGSCHPTSLRAPVALTQSKRDGGSFNKNATSIVPHLRVLKPIP
uniref:Putative MO25-like protein n=1 Tax=Aegilops tauschii TaxID=37682 RepID=M8BIM1_AEGTA